MIEIAEVQAAGTLDSVTITGVEGGSAIIWQNVTTFVADTRPDDLNSPDIFGL